MDQTKMVYNITGIVAGNETGMLEFIQGINTELMGGWLGALFLIGVGFVIFTSLMLKSEDVTRSMASTMFILFALSMPIVALELLTPLAIFITLVGAALAVAVSWKGN